MSHVPENAPTEKLDEDEPGTVSLRAEPALDATLDAVPASAAPIAETIGLSAEPSGGGVDKYPPSYDVQRELGRGGMGVVYQARQVHANRMVALKMILSGGHASPTDRIRFQMEAEAVARLSHPNIVQVYEVGEHAGNPFFSLEYCAGGTLAEKLDGKPLAPRAAASLIQQLARAMAMAHSTGVVHRDLKPANILFTGDDVAKITDFGLAKRLDEDSAQTRSGSILGTPSYMAPEQAQGNTKQVGPAADIYALGTILYECLTGKPPFRGDSIMATLQMVRDREPAPPSQSMRGLPRDLETICLKCLRKEPLQRYASAAELADDLERFLQGEPIQARRVGTFERAVLWVRRNKVVAGLIAAVILASLIGSGVSLQFAWIAGDAALKANDAALDAKKNERIAQAETLRAQEKEKALAAALAEVETTLVKGFTQSFGFGDSLTDGDKVSIVHLQTIKGRQVRLRFLREMLASGPTRLVNHKEILTQVIVGLDPQARDEAAAFLKGWMKVNDPYGRYACVAVAGELQWKDEEFSRDAMQALVEYTAVLGKLPQKPVSWHPRLFDLATHLEEHAYAVDNAKAREAATGTHSLFSLRPAIDKVRPGTSSQAIPKLMAPFDAAGREEIWLNEVNRIVKASAGGTVMASQIHSMSELLRQPERNALLTPRAPKLVNWCPAFVQSAFLNDATLPADENIAICLKHLPRECVDSALVKFLDIAADTASFDPRPRNQQLIGRVARHKDAFPRETCVPMLLKVMENSLEDKGPAPTKRQLSKIAGLVNVLQKGQEPIAAERILAIQKKIADQMPKEKTTNASNDHAEALWLLADSLSEKDRRQSSLQIIEHYRKVEPYALFAPDRNGPLDLALLMAGDANVEPIGAWVADVTLLFMEQIKINSLRSTDYTTGTITPSSLLRRLMQHVPDKHLDRLVKKVHGDLLQAREAQSVYLLADLLLILDRTQSNEAKLKNAHLVLKRFDSVGPATLTAQFLALPHSAFFRTAYDRLPPAEARKHANGLAKVRLEVGRVKKSTALYDFAQHIFLARFGDYLEPDSVERIVSAITINAISDLGFSKAITSKDETLASVALAMVEKHLPKLEARAQRSIAMDCWNLASTKWDKPDFASFAWRPSPDGDRVLLLTLERIPPRDLHDWLANPYTPTGMRDRIVREVARRAGQPMAHQWDADAWLQKKMAATRSAAK